MEEIEVNKKRLAEPFPVSQTDKTHCRRAVQEQYLIR